MKTIKVRDKDVPFDDSKSATGFADVFIEDAINEGVIYIGFGSLVTQNGSDDMRVEGIAHLRFTPEMAVRAAEALLNRAQLVKTPLPVALGKGRGN